MSKQDTKLTPQILAMYIENCEAIAKTQRGENWRGKLAGIYSDINVHLRMESGEVATFRPDEVKPILRRLEDMTEEEAIECGYGFKYAHNGEFNWYLDRHPVSRREPHQHYPTHLLVLLSKSFDLFGLCDAGLAIDQKTIQDG